MHIPFLHWVPVRLSRKCRQSACAFFCTETVVLASEPFLKVIRISKRTPSSDKIGVQHVHHLSHTDFRRPKDYIPLRHLRSRWISSNLNRKRHSGQIYCQHEMNVSKLRTTGIARDFERWRLLSQFLHHWDQVYRSTQHGSPLYPWPSEACLD